MKKSIFIVAVLMTLLTSAEVFAGNSATTRNRCWWFLHRYAATAHLSTWKCGFNYSYASDRNCSRAYVDLQRRWCCGATSVSHAEANSSGQYCFMHLYCGVNGGMQNQLLEDANPDINDPSIPEEGSQNQKVFPHFGPHEVILQGISLNLTSAISADNNNSATFAVWVPNDDTTTGVEDTVYDPTRAITAGTVSLIKGRIEVTGDIFTPADFSVTRSTTNYIVNYIGGDKVLPLPPDVNIDNVAFTNIGDIIPNSGPVMKGLATTGNGVLAGEAKLEVYPNPAANNLNLQFSDAKETTVSVSIYDNVGKRIRVIDNLSLANGNSNLGIDISSLPAGSYFMLVKGENMKIVKQFVKN